MLHATLVDVAEICYNKRLQAEKKQSCNCKSFVLKSNTRKLPFSFMHTDFYQLSTSEGLLEWCFCMAYSVAVLYPHPSDVAARGTETLWLILLMF